MFTSLLDAIAGLPAWLLVVLALGLSAGEAGLGLDLLVPGEVGLVLIGAATEDHGAGTTAAAIVAGAAGAVAGDSCSWWLGRRFGTALVERWGWVRERLEPSLERSRSSFERHGGRSVAGARWIGALRAVVPFVAGTSDLRYRSLLVWDVPSALLWSATVVLVGRVAGRPAADAIDRFQWIASAVVVAALAAWFLLRRRKRRAVGGAAG